LSAFMPKATSADELAEIPVVGTVEAGAWREPQIAASGDETIILPHPDYTGRRRYALEVRGQSMDLVFPPGMYLDCVDVIENGEEPIPGDYVIVERYSGHLRETTCKLLVRLPDGSLALQAESTRPEFAEPILLGNPSVDHFEDSEIRVVAVVLGAYRKIANKTRLRDTSRN
jgi:repressor LexA